MGIGVETANRDRMALLLLAAPAAAVAAGLALLPLGPPWALVAAATALGWTQLSGP